jgi:phosphoribosylanthranilate isomerase
MFHVKICGITTAADAAMVVQERADAVGLNFYPLGPRCVTLGQAEDIVGVLPSEVARVGVFVNSPSAEIRTMAGRLRLDYVQIHGDEPPEFLAELAGYATIRALRCGSDFAAASDYLDRCRALGCPPAALLIDAHHPHQYGGTGDVADWQALAAARASFADVPLILAGGLNPGNVAQAIAIVRPSAVDAASGVELAPGKKSQHLVHSFVEAALAGFAGLARA